MARIAVANRRVNEQLPASPEFLILFKSLNGEWGGF
jgi:hypothetical protein